QPRSVPQADVEQPGWERIRARAHRVPGSPGGARGRAICRSTADHGQSSAVPRRRYVVIEAGSVRGVAVQGDASPGRILVVGSTNVDLVLEVPRHPLPGETLSSTRTR